MPRADCRQTSSRSANTSSEIGPFGEEIDMNAFMPPLRSVINGKLTRKYQSWKTFLDNTCWSTELKQTLIWLAPIAQSGLLSLPEIIVSNSFCYDCRRYRKVFRQFAFDHGTYAIVSRFQ